jgi:hypothetical protein
MKFPDQLRSLWESRAVGAQGASWFSKQYEEAVERVQDHTGDPTNPYYHAPADPSDAYNDDAGPHIFDEFGGESTIEETRARAFELLVLCDVAAFAPKPRPRTDKT